MSQTEQATLGTVVEDRVERHRRSRSRQLEAIGAIYRGGDGGEVPESRPEQECLNCGTSIDPEVARVSGDRDGNVPCCRECVRTRDGTRPRSTTLAVRMVEHHEAIHWTVVGGDEES